MSWDEVRCMYCGRKWEPCPPECPSQWLDFSGRPLAHPNCESVALMLSVIGFVRF